MKRLSLLKKIALGSGAIAAVTPIALMSTSCAIENITADFIDFNSIRSEGDYSKANISSVSFKRLLFGSKKVFNGNYILFVGSNMSPTACEFYSGSKSLRTRENWFKTSEQSKSGHLWDSPFYMGIDKAGKFPIKNFGIFNVIDFWDNKVYDNKGHEIVVCEKPNSPTQIISPWAKWTDEMITQTKLYNKTLKYDWDEKSVKAKETYIRNDSSAVAYREFNKVGAKVYPTNDKRKKTFDISDGNTACKMLIFVDGVLKSAGKDEKEIIDIQDMPTTKDAWYDVIYNNFKDEEKPKPSK